MSSTLLWPPLISIGGRRVGVAVGTVAAAVTLRMIVWLYPIYIAFVRTWRFAPVDGYFLDFFIFINITFQKIFLKTEPFVHASLATSVTVTYLGVA